MGILLEARSDTLRMIMSLIITVMGLYPDWVQRSREHLDCVCGDAALLLKFEDRAKLIIAAAMR